MHFASWCWSFMHLLVLYGYQGAAADPEQLALTDQLFDAALAELSVVARGQPCLMVGDFQRGAHQNPLPGKRDFRLGSGLILKVLGLWLLVGNLLLLVGVSGVLLVVLVVILWLVALLWLLLF